MDTQNLTKKDITANNLMETILEKIENSNANQIHHSMPEQITAFSREIVEQLGAEFIENKRLIISEQLAKQILNNANTGSKLFAKIGLGKIKISEKNLRKLRIKYVSQNKSDSRIYDYEQNILSKIKENNITKQSFIHGIKLFVNTRSKKFAPSYKKKLLNLNEDNVGKLTKAELSELRKKDPEAFDMLILTKNSLQRRTLPIINTPLKMRKKEKQFKLPNSPIKAN